LATDGGAAQDLRTYASENWPMPPHRAALLVASLAEQLALVNAEGSAYGHTGAGAVHVTGPGPRVVSTPPPPAAPPAGEPTPQPGTTYRTSPFDVPSGGARPPFVHGELIWYARSVGVSAVVSSTSPCAAAVFTGYSGSTQVSHIATAYRCGSVPSRRT
jgi:hypothetical protein